MYKALLIAISVVFLFVGAGCGNDCADGCAKAKECGGIGSKTEDE